MNVEQNLIKGRDMFRETLDALESKTVSALVNLYAEVIRSTSDEIVLTELERSPRYINDSTISQYNIAVQFIGKDGGKYFKKARLSVKFSNGDPGIVFEKEIFK
jgi:hypothetical protein